MTSVASVFRKSDSNLVYPVWEAIQDNHRTDIKQIVKFLARSRSLSEFESLELIDNLKDDGLIILDENTQTFSLPQLDKSKKKQPWNSLLTRDCYCYECHASGSVLSCSECPRVFHVGCIRPDSEVDLPLLPFSEPVPDLVRDTFILVYGYAYTKSSSDAGGSKSPKISPESRRKCINCRVRELNKFDIKDTSRLNLLLNKSFSYIRTWIANDTFSEQEKNSVHIPDKYIEMLSPVLFQNKCTADDVAMKISTGKYKSLVEYYCDVMDVKHCIGVLRGVESPEYEAAKYLTLDALHSIIEISVCQDCYGHSSENKNDDGWFIEPCKPPHELVYAKQAGYSFWPAKVIRKFEMSYDVRFFGVGHTRSNISMRNIRPIDQKPSMKRSSSLDKAMEEFAVHRLALLNHDTSPAEPKKWQNNEVVKSDSNFSVQRKSVDRDSNISVKRKSVDRYSNISVKRKSVDRDSNISVQRKSVDRYSNISVKRKSVDRDSNISVQRKSVDRDSNISVKRKSVDRYSNISVKRKSVDRDSNISVQRKSVDRYSNISVKRKSVDRDSNISVQRKSVDRDSNISVKRKSVDRDSNISDQRKSVDRDSNISVKRKSVDRESNISVKRKSVDSQNNNHPTIKRKPSMHFVFESSSDSSEDSDETKILTSSDNSDASRTNSPVLATQGVPPMNESQFSTENYCQPYIDNIIRAMAGCPQDMVDLALNEFRQFAQALEAERNQHAEDLIAAKLGHYCYRCHEIAVYHCCSNVDYCTVECQNSHWHKHRKVCQRNRKSTHSESQTDDGSFEYEE